MSAGSTRENAKLTVFWSGCTLHIAAALRDEDAPLRHSQPPTSLGPPRPAPLFSLCWISLPLSLPQGCIMALHILFLPHRNTFPKQPLFILHPSPSSLASTINSCPLLGSHILSLPRPNITYNYIFLLICAMTVPIWWLHEPGNHHISAFITVSLEQPHTTGSLIKCVTGGKDWQINGFINWVLFFLWATLHSISDLSSLTRDQTPCRPMLEAES